MAILGAGAAGLWCAVTAGRRGRRAVVIEHNDCAGKKILISGGGRCNFTNLRAAPEHYLSRNPRFCASALARFPPARIVAEVEAGGVAWHEKKDGQLFCDGSSRQVLNMLLAACGKAGVEARPGCRVLEVAALSGADADAARFRVATTGGEVRARRLVVATGGLSYPKLGASDLGYRLAKQFGLEIVPPRPGLVPFTFARTDADVSQHAGGEAPAGGQAAAAGGVPPLDPALADLAGVSVPARVRCGGAEFTEGLLFTHRGLSGPVILQASLYWTPGEPVEVDLAPDCPIQERLRAARAARPTARLNTALGDILPKSLAAFPRRGPPPTTPLRSLSDHDIAAVARGLHGWRFVPGGVESYDRAEVTVGGVDTRGLSSKTLEARDTPGLYFIGEVLDVTGFLGGFNFQWAWASASAAGEAV